MTTTRKIHYKTSVYGTRTACGTLSMPWNPTIKRQPITSTFIDEVTCPTCRSMIENYLPLCHIRREDECEITFCGLLTDVCIDPQSTEPIGVPGGKGEMAIYADHDYLPGFRTCWTCHNAYMALYV